ncbi:MAG: hypothetical protein GX638_10700 [Crenarchaeota archaeon]|nr:hypothetical protein [Thermoproteota archaeon]
MLDPMLGVWIAVDPKRFFSSPYLYMGNGYNPLVNADTTGNNPVAEIGVRIAIATPSAIHNMYQTQNKLAENGASWFEMSYKGAATLFSTLLLSAVLPQANNPIVAGLLGAGTSATTNIINQKYIDGNESLDLNEVSNEARNGFMIGSFSAFGNAVASKVLLEPASTFVGDAIGTTTDVLLNQCEDK